MNHKIKNGLKILTILATMYTIEACTSKTEHDTEIQLKCEECKEEYQYKLLKYFSEKEEKTKKRFYHEIATRDSLKGKLSTYIAAKQKGPNNQGLYVVNQNKENNFEARIYTKQGLDSIIKTTSESIGNDWIIKQDSADYIKYKTALDEIREWINYQR
ncbi:MAG: hypothetical protein ACP5N1_01105 [Candidatus Woesearchaeota archaeon]